MAISTYRNAAILALRSLVGLLQEQVDKDLQMSEVANSDEDRLNTEIEELEQLLSQLETSKKDSDNDWPKPT